METEVARLERLYHEMSDEHLMDLAKDPDSLTGEAHGVLNREMHTRRLHVASADAARMHRDVEDHAAPEPVQEPELEQGFTPGIPGLFPSSAAIMEQALEPAGEVVDGRARLISFYDGHELARACETLEAAGIMPEIESVAGDAMSGAPPRFDIWIEAGRLQGAESLLREAMGLFPLAEQESPQVAHSASNSIVELGDNDGMLTVAEFESDAEAAQTMRLLNSQGIAARLDEQRADEDGMYAVQVRAEDQQRALAAVAAALGVN